MKLQLDNLIYTTDDKLQIERLEDLGAVEFDDNGIVKEDETSEKKEGTNYSEMKVEDIKHLLKEKGIEFDSKAKKEELISLLSEKKVED